MKKLAEGCRKYLSFVRQKLHFFAETQWKETITREIITALSKDFCCKTYASEFCVVLFFDFGSKFTTALRAEQDALPIEEKTGLSFACTQNNMHACGHDGHMAIALGLAKVLSDAIKNSGQKNPFGLKKNLAVLFEPAEEGFGGAQRLLSEEFVKDKNINSAFALHLFPSLPKNKIFCKTGAICAGSREVDVTFFGKKAHVAKAKDGKDALYTASKFLCQSQEQLDGLDGFLRFGALTGGCARNVVCDKAVLKGTMRFFDKKTAYTLAEGAKRILFDLKTQTGVNFTFCDGKETPPVINDQILVELAKNCFEILPAPKSLICDDFGVFATKMPVAYFLLGTGDGASLHSDTFDFDESDLVTGLEFCLCFLGALK